MMLRKFVFFFYDTKYNNLRKKSIKGRDILHISNVKKMRKAYKIKIKL